MPPLRGHTIACRGPFYRTEREGGEGESLLRVQVLLAVEATQHADELRGPGSGVDVKGLPAEDGGVVDVQGAGGEDLVREAGLVDGVVVPGLQLAPGPRRPPVLASILQR